MASTKTSGKIYPTRIDLSLEIRTEVINSLGLTLATTLDLHTQIKQAHWTVKGLDFFQLHQLFDELATEIEDYVDLVAERITALGGTPLGTARIAASVSLLPEYPFDSVQGIDHVTALADRFALYGSHVRKAIATTGDLGDADTSDLYTEISRTIDKRLWFLEAHLVK
ncbi:MAG: DNA starvation/stationary phase protection protein Dps [Microcystaceae cyanobacterium]